MNVAAKLGGFVLALGVVFVGAYGAGALAGPVGGSEQGAHEMTADDGAGHGPAALPAGDLAYLHVHPQQTASAGPAITFDVEVPTPGEYRLFLDFQHGSVVRTAAVTPSPPDPMEEMS